jgi:uncharacterized membrane protein
MTLLDRTEGQIGTGQRSRQGRQRQQRGRSNQKQVNVGSTERSASLAAGSLITMLGLSRRSVPGLLIAGLGGMIMYRGASGHCSAYAALGVNTAEGEEATSPEEISERGIHVEQALLVDRSPEDLYKYWRNFENLPQIMSHLKSVKVTGDKQSKWEAKAPMIAGGSATWEAEITADEPNSRIAWKSLPGSEIDSVGEIRFSKAMGDRGTEVHVSMEYLPPAGKVGHWLATIFGKAPRTQIHEDLRSFKRLMETGEIVTIEGQPRGKCMGSWKSSR